MKKENYLAWEVKVGEFNKLKSSFEKFSFLLNFAVLAPSSHNTQPWNFKIKNNTISVYKENKRRLPIADSNDRQLHLSVGCAIQNILIAANYFGYTANLEYKNNSDSPNLIAIISLEEQGKTPETESLIHSITTRKTNRGKYKIDKISSSIIDEIVNNGDSEIKVNVVSDQAKINKLGYVAAVAASRSMENRDFRIELSHHLKNNLTRSKIGMPGFSIGIPTPPSFLLAFLMRMLNLEKIGQKQNIALFEKSTPHIVIISSATDTTEDWIKAGLKFQKISLFLDSKGISTSPWGAPIQIENFYKEIQDILDIKERPQMFFRIGYPIKSSRVSPRLLVNDVLS